MAIGGEEATEFLDGLIAVRELLNDALESRALLGIPMPQVDASIDSCTEMLGALELQLFPYLSKADKARLTSHLAANKNEFGSVQ